jgi:hypothetical protein
MECDDLRQGYQANYGQAAEHKMLWAARAKVNAREARGETKESVIAEGAVRCRKMNSRSEALGGVAQYAR